MITLMEYQENMQNLRQELNLKVIASKPVLKLKFLIPIGLLELSLILDLVITGTLKSVSIMMMTTMRTTMKIMMKIMMMNFTLMPPIFMKASKGELVLSMKLATCVEL